MAAANVQVGGASDVTGCRVLCSDALSNVKNEKESSETKLSTTSSTLPSETDSLETAKGISQEETRDGFGQSLPVSGRYAFTPGLLYDARGLLRASRSESRSIQAMNLTARVFPDGPTNSTYISMKDLSPKCANSRAVAPCKSAVKKKGSSFSYISPARKLSSNRQACSNTGCLKVVS